MGDMVEAGDGSNDEQRNAETMPSIVQMGSVRGLPTLTLNPDGGPSCSALLTSSGHSLHLEIKTKFGW